MQAASDALAPALADAHFRDLSIPLLANTTAHPITAAADLRRELVHQVAGPVCWTSSVQYMAAAGTQTFVEIGPGKALTGLIKRIAPAASLVNLQF
jgi:[acyl-carrier-protein] S-malonyltransferase